MYDTEVLGMIHTALQKLSENDKRILNLYLETDNNSSEIFLETEYQGEKQVWAIHADDIQEVTDESEVS